jgi:hypothetical protein
MIELLRAVGLDDTSSFAWGLLAGATVVALNISAWFVGESLLERLVVPSRVAEEDQAIRIANAPGREATR